MEAYIGYAILFIAFCVLPLVAVWLIFFVIRAAWKIPAPQPQQSRQPAAPQAQPTQQHLQAKLTQLAQAAEQAPDLRSQMRSNQAAPATVSKSVGKPIAPSSIKGSAGKIAPVYLTLSSQPSTILRGMDELVAKTRTVNAAGQRWKWMPRLGFFVGLGMIAIDVLLYFLGYPSCVFSIGALAIWIAAFVFSRALKRQQSSEFPAGYQNVRQIIHTLRDDLKPGAPLLGHLDLTGYKQEDKVARETTDTMNRTTQHFRDEWLSLKAKLYDGNVLRVSAVQRAKIRKAYWKRSTISGETKSKPEKFKGSLNELKVRIVVNPEAYTIAPNEQVAPGQAIGQYTIAQVNTEGGMINLTAHTPDKEVEPESILNVLLHTYGLLQRKVA
jgi:Flp pilus assembly protein TadB